MVWFVGAGASIRVNGVAVTAAGSAVAARAAASAIMTSLQLVALAAILKIASACNDCVVLGKAERAMFARQGVACAAESLASAAAVAALVAGEPVDSPALRRHVLCVLSRSKLVGKDGKPLKAAAPGKLASRPDGRLAAKALESCSVRSPSLAPEDAAWTLFRCGYGRKGAGSTRN